MNVNDKFVVEQKKKMKKRRTKKKKKKKNREELNEIVHFGSPSQLNSTKRERERVYSLTYIERKNHLKLNVVIFY